MIKSKELNDPTSCLNRAEKDEPMFVLLARDKVAPETIRSWITHRLVSGKNRMDDEKIIEAYKCLHEMEKWRRENDNETKTL